MNAAQLWEHAGGGVLPHISRRPREVFVVDGVQHTIRIVWFRRTVEIAYTTPRYPRDVRRIREAESRKLAESVRRREAGEPLTQVGDVFGEHQRYIPVQVARCRDAQGDVWRRAYDSEAYSSLDDGLPIEHRQVYDWVHPYVDGDGVEHLAGHATDEGVLTHTPVVVLEIREDVPA
jgi:hypothetical protein